MMKADKRGLSSLKPVKKPRTIEEKKFVEAVLQGLRDIEDGQVISFSEFKKKFKIKVKP